MTILEGTSHIKRLDPHGFTLVELILVIVIAGILIGVAVQNGTQLYDASRIEETRQEMEALASAITGNPALENNGVRSDFGYVGDVGSLPPNLEALHINPGSFTTWKGPYLGNRFAQVANDYRRDAWGIDYSYAGTTVTSTGSGSPIVKRLAGSPAELVANTVSGNVYDANGTPPGASFFDSITVTLTHPDGAGDVTSRGASVTGGGYFSFASVPIGNHSIAIVYEPTADTVYHFVSVTPGSSVYVQYRLGTDLWYASTSTVGYLEKVTGSDSLVADCHGFFFWIENNTGGPVEISSISVSYPGLTGYYRYVRWNGMAVVDAVNPRLGSGDLAVLSSPQTISDGESVRIDVDFFKSAPNGGSNVEVNNTAFTITLSDGSSFDVTTGGCP
jgi:general secretion pathway protein G